MLQKIFYNSLNISKFTRICMENNSSVIGWQELFSPYKFFYFSAAIVIIAFEILYRWKFTVYLILIIFMLFQFMLTKILKRELFSCVQKVDHVIN